jgi:hypothetical protein
MTLERELAFFEAHRQDWLHHHAGKFVLIIGERLLGTYDSPARAYEAGVEAVGNAPMLIKQVTEADRPEQVPALALVLTDARL